MKCRIEIDCTPEEARTFFGLPDMQPMQGRILAEIEKKMFAGLERYTPEAILKQWLSLSPVSPEQMQDMLAQMVSVGRRGRS